MQMIGHQEKGMNFDTELLGRNLQLLQIKSVITLTQKNTSRLFPRWIIWREQPGTYNSASWPCFHPWKRTTQNSTAQKNHFLFSPRIKEPDPLIPMSRTDSAHFLHHVTTLIVGTLGGAGLILNPGHTAHGVQGGHVILVDDVIRRR